MNKYITIFLSIMTCVVCTYAKGPKTVTIDNDKVFITLDWHEQTPELSKEIFRFIKNSSSDSTKIFVSFHENGLVDKYGNDFIFFSDTTKIGNLCNNEIRRFKNEKYFNNQFALTDSIETIRNWINQALNVDAIISQAEEEASNIDMTEDELLRKISCLQHEFEVIFDSNPFNPLDKKDNDKLEIPSYSNSLYYIIRTKELLNDIIKWRGILYCKYPNSNEPELIED